jgi:prepilin-type N-terminal cleavage/methylation domain-containing protein/prepilin-type processing-associated H-X9-DG protein
LRAVRPTHSGRTFSARWYTPRRRDAFTLAETLVVISIIALLLAMLVPALRTARGRMHSLKCASNLRTVSFQFLFFVEEGSPMSPSPGGRAGGTPFHISDFQESLYRIDEFWDLGSKATGELSAQDEILMCPAGPKRLFKRRGYPCGRESITPRENVSIGFNMRLYRGTKLLAGHPVLAQVAATKVRADILNHPNVPLVLDVNGKTSTVKRQDPYYTAPALDSTVFGDPYYASRYWIPSDRHQGKTMVGFVGGHVLSSAQPEREAWDWAYQAWVN